MLKRINLINFRNFLKKEIDFSKTITVIVGDNAVGKTNILESIFLLSTGKSFKATHDSEMVNSEQEVARAIGYIDDLELKVALTNGEVKVGDNIKRTQVKRLFVNDIPRRMVDFAGILKTVLFSPSDVALVDGTPSMRRKYLDFALSQVDREYRRSLMSYEKGVRQRNRILIQIREFGAPRSHLSFWDQLVIKNGDYLTNKRAEFIEFINRTSSLACRQAGLNDTSFQIFYDKSIISESRLAQYEKEEVMAGTTLVGPHRDDFKISIGSHDLAIYGSRGEQRMGVLWLKLAELQFIESVSNEKPTLLLDDIFSELDHAHRQIVFEVVKNYQSVLTTADPHYVEGIEGEVVKI